MINTIIFDWSGVISDDWEPTYCAHQDELEHYGKKRISRKEFKKKFRLPYYEYCRDLGITASVEELRNNWLIFFDKHKHKTKVIKHAKETLEWLAKNRFRIFVLSSHNQEFVDAEIKKYKVGHAIEFAKASVENKVFGMKQLLEEKKISPREAVFVGDMLHDIETAKKNSVKSIAVLTGYDSKEKLLKAKPDFIIKDLRELKKVIKKLNGKTGSGKATLK